MARFYSVYGGATMECIYCGNDKAYVVDTRSCSGCVIRKRKCKECGKSFYTKEEEAMGMSEIREYYSILKMRYRDRKKSISINH